MFVVDKDRHGVVQEASCVLFADDDNSSERDDTRAGPTTHDTFAVFEDLCLLVKESARNSFNSRPLSVALELR
jgi:hypothetical protein